MKEFLRRLFNRLKPEAKWDPARGTGTYTPGFLGAYYTDDPTGPPSQEPRRRARTPANADPRPQRDLDRRGPSTASLRVFAELIATQSATATHFAQTLEGNGYRLVATHLILAGDQLSAASAVLASQTGGSTTPGEMNQGIVGQTTSMLLQLSALRQACDERGDADLAYRLKDAERSLRSGLEKHGVVYL